MLFIFDILFRIHKRDTAAEKGFETGIADGTRAGPNSDIHLDFLLWLIKTFKEN